MNDNMTDSGQQPDSLDEDALRRRLINRIALAGVAIVALLGGLAVIDSLYVAPTPSPRKVSVAPVITETVKPVEADALPPVAPEEETAEAETPPAPPEPPKPQAVPTIRNPAEAEESASPTTPLPRQTHQPAKPAELRPAVVKPAPPPALAQILQSERHFVLQMGVFNNVNNAQELLARLQKNGIPAQIEARVQVGPFKNKTEADEARAKLKAMGLDPGLLVTVHR